MHIIVISFVRINLYVYVLCAFDFTIYMICYMFHDLHRFLLKISMS